MTEETKKKNEQENPLNLAQIVIGMKIKSEDAEANLKAEIDKIMQSDRMASLSKSAEDSRLDYEMKKMRLTELMIESGLAEIKTHDGHCVKILTNGDKKTLKVIPKR